MFTTTSTTMAILYIGSSLLLGLSLLMTLFLVREHWKNVGQDPEWRNIVLSLLPLFPLYGLYGFFLLFTKERYSIYLTSLIHLIDAISLDQLFRLLLFLFNKQSSLFFQDDAYVHIELKSSKDHGHLSDTIKAKTNYCFIRCIGFLLKSVDESHPLLIYGAKFLRYLENILVIQILLRIISLLITLSLGHNDYFYHYYPLIEWFNWTVSFFIGFLVGLFLFVTERVFLIHRPRFKFYVILLPILSTSFLLLILPLSLSSIILQMEQIFLLLSTFWIFSPQEHTQTSLLTQNSAT